MKKVLALTLSLLTTLSFASGVNCLHDVENQYLEMTEGTRFDRMPSISFVQDLEAGEVFEIRRQADVGPFNQFKYIFKVTGSIHSGWFSDAIVVNPTTCEIERIQEIDSE